MTKHTDFLDSALSSETNACIFWPYGKSGAGYGFANVSGERIYAHRFICAAAHGAPISPKMHAAHSCGNPACVNPRHLRWATAKQNAADKKLHGTNNDGERHGLAVLTDQQASYIRKMVDSGMKQRRLAEMFGVSPMMVSRLVRRETYKTAEAI